jgi:hypothetical protein
MMQQDNPVGPSPQTPQAQVQVQPQAPPQSFTFACTRTLG